MGIDARMGGSQGFMLRGSASHVAARKTKGSPTWGALANVSLAGNGHPFGAAITRRYVRSFSLSCKREWDGKPFHKPFKHLVEIGFWQKRDCAAPLRKTTWGHGRGHIAERPRLNTVNLVSEFERPRVFVVMRHGR